MPENVYEESRLAALYDYFNPWDDQDAFYLGRGRQCDGPVLDLDCGTGRLAVHIAEETDLAVTGAEPGTGMFHSTRSVLGLERVEWIQDLDQTFKTPTRFAFAYMTRHAFQPVHTSEAATALLANVARNLTTEGRFVFETRNPEDRAWDRWAGDHTVVNTKEHSPVQESYEVEELSDGLIALSHHIRLISRGEEFPGRNRLCFPAKEQGAGECVAAGLEVVEWYCDWDGGPFHDDSAEMIAVTGRAS